MNYDPNPITIIGLMSGTSLDGLDICAVNFINNSYSIIAAKTIKYSVEFALILNNAYNSSALEIAQLDVDFGVFCGKEVSKFIKEFNIKANYIASHGQTIFHTPHTGLTLQIGNGAHIAKEAGIPTINDFRTLDVVYGGQGAPLVPIGDELLFSEFDYCLNIGGFANVSTNTNNKRIAWDICPTNIVINEYAKAFNKDFDENGDIGKQGELIPELLSELDNIDFYSQKAPKSLGREWVDIHINPILNKYTESTNIMRTLYEHMGKQIGLALTKPNSKTLCTGGGTYNSFLISCIKKYTNSKIIIPEKELIDFKEALLFAYLGYLRIQNKPNCLASVTGASKDVCGGVIHYIQ